MRVELQPIAIRPGAVHAFGGEVLKFIGDGVLAIFPVIGRREARLRRNEKTPGAVRRANWRHARLTHARRSFGARHDVDLDLRHLVQAQHVVPIEVALLHSAALNGELRFHHGAETEADPAFHLGADHVRVDRDAAIDGADDAFDLRLAVAVAAEATAPLVPLGEHVLRGIAAPCAVFTLPDA